MRKVIIVFLVLITLLFLFLYLHPADKRNHSEKDPIDELIKNMTVEEKIGQMLMPVIDGTKATPQLEKMIKDYHLGGVILFSENIQSIEQIVKLTNDIQSLSLQIPLFISTDQEGGLVYRLSQGTKFPGNMALGATFSEDLAYKVGKVIGSELKAVGINWDLAPVMDVNVNPYNPVIGIRSFGGNPDVVAKLGVAFMKGLQENKIASCVKHFPGHGDVDVDSHLGLGTVNKNRETLEKIELKPFEEAIQAGTDALMTAHLSFPALDDTKVIAKTSEGVQKEITIPATLSHKILTDLVRKTWGYEGVIITDAMNMKAISDNFGPVDAVVRAVKAGADIILMPVDLNGAFNELVLETKKGIISEKRIDDSVRRILKLKYKLGLMETKDIDLENMIQQARAIVGNEKNLLVEKEVAERSITLLRNSGNLLPLGKETLNKKILIIGGTKDLVNGFVNELKKYHPGNNAFLVINNGTLRGSGSLTSDLKKAIDGSDIVILMTNNIMSPNSLAEKIVNYGGDKVIGIAVRNPYDIMYYPQVKVYLVQYGWNPCSIKAMVDVLFGAVNPTGKLPVEIPGLYPIGYGLSY